MKIHWKQYRKCYIKIGIVLLLLVCECILFAVGSYLTGQLSAQQFVSRWNSEDGFAQLSCFLGEQAELTVDMIPGIENQLQTDLKDSSVDISEGGRKWVDAYSTKSELTVASDRTSTQVRAYGVSKDFFQFHPLELLSGSYFTNDDFKQDGIILDELVAWQLFGSADVAGLQVDIEGETYIIRGVVRSEHGWFSEAAQEETPTVYVDYAVLMKYEEEVPIECYELLIANPVQGFGADKLSSVLTDYAGLDEDSFEIVENSGRYSWINSLKRIAQFGKRSMKLKQVVYPSWENRARAYEDISSLFVIIEILLLVYPIVSAVQLVVWICKRKGRLFF